MRTVLVVASFLMLTMTAAGQSRAPESEVNPDFLYDFAELVGWPALG